MAVAINAVAIWVRARESLLWAVENFYTLWATVTRLGIAILITDRFRWEKIIWLDFCFEVGRDFPASEPLGG
ncbi:MAG: hypothetical protein ACI8PT_000620, partial [Gammaproteobacteria bacterium]